MTTSEVKCRDCDRPLDTPLSRARRRGEKCWRQYRAELRRQATPTPLPAMPAPRRAAQTGEALINEEEVRTDG